MSKLIQTRTIQNGKRSRAQATFDKLIREIGEWRERLQHWQQYEGRFRQRIANDLEPAQQRWRERRREMAILIDRLLTDPPPGRALGKRQRARLGELLQRLAQSVLNETPDDAELAAVFDRYSDVSHQELADAEMDATRAMLAELGVELDADDEQRARADMETLLQRAAEQLAEQFEREQQDEEAAEAQRQANRSGAAAKRAAAAQARKEQAEQEVSQSVREVYRKLASRLHPDRESDPAERERKTALMQRVNQAYESRDLLTLLTLQIEIEQISADDLASAPEQRIKHYNQVLTEQRDELEAEVMGFVMRFGTILGPEMPLHPSFLTPQLIERELDADIRALRQKIATLEKDLANFHDRRYLGEWLRIHG
jgi:chemotaxis protein histidine kinase CheA